MDSSAGEGFGDFFRAGLRAVRYEDRGSALLDEVAGSQLRHFSGADDQNGLSLQ